MIYETTITILPEEEKNTSLIESKVLKQLNIKNRKDSVVFTIEFSDK